MGISHSRQPEREDNSRTGPATQPRRSAFQDLHHRLRALDHIGEVPDSDTGALGHRELPVPDRELRVEQIIGQLREAEVELVQGLSVAEACRSLGVSEQTDYRWRKEYGSLKMDQAKRLKVLEQENTRLRRAVANLTLDKQILQEVTRGNG